ncbi:MAG: glycosyltransferase family 4 protein, partial [Gammaproteobacteria bacterium]
SNTPLDMLQVVQKTCRRLGVRFVFWVQDLYGYAIAQILGPRFAGLGALVGAYYKRKERRLLSRSDHAVVITEDFKPFLLEAGMRDGAITVIPNWAPLEEMPRRDKSNAWGRAHGLDRTFVFLYSGTLGLKHDPGLLLELADRFQGDPEVRIVVISEGLGADWLRRAQAETPRPNLLLLPFQNFEDMPEVVASADVLVALLEQSAGVFSVPSKVLTYLCAGRPILLAAPMENQAARMIYEAGAGTACPAGDHAQFLAAASALRSDPDRVARNGESARRYAESRFDVERIVERFMEVLYPAPAHAPCTTD